MCFLLECVSQFTNPYGLMRDCLFYFLWSSFCLYLYCHFCSCLCAIYFFFPHVSDVNLLFKKERKYLRAVFGNACGNTPQRPGGGRETSLPAHLSNHLEIKIRAKEKPRTQEHMCYVCLLSGVCPKETRTPGASAPQPCSQPLQSTLWPRPLIPPLFLLLLFQNMLSCSTLSFLHRLARQVCVAWLGRPQSLLMPHTDPSLSNTVTQIANSLWQQCSCVATKRRGKETEGRLCVISFPVSF